MTAVQPDLFGEVDRTESDLRLARHLVGNHIALAAVGDDRALLASRMARGRELGLDVDAIVAAARAEVAA